MDRKPLWHVHAIGVDDGNSTIEFNTVIIRGYQTVI